jgi:hypothetical protein
MQHIKKNKGLPYKIKTHPLTSTTKKENRYSDN